MDWIIGIQRAVDYIEDNLTETINYDEVAKKCYSSSYHFQRVFSILCGFTLGEYIRNRRLTLAGRELATTNAKVIDVAMKYGYESPDSFAKAFQKFHGILPSQARSNGSNLKSFSRLVLKFSLEGGTTMKYRIETKPELTLIGYKKRFNGTPYDSLRQHQEGEFFASTRAFQWMLKGMTNDKLSDYCVLSDFDDDGYNFYIAVTTDDYERNNLYNSEVTGIDFMEKFEFEEIVIPERTYIIFETEKTKMPIPEYFDMRKQIATEWLTDNDYQIIKAPELAVYHWGIVGGCPERTIEIWLPIEKK
ncbi:MAG: AraC family transcriptional regulator [Clostridia bacterium]|nr:AraC family transcriptional regulator [Clostridia bacterium]